MISSSLTQIFSSIRRKYLKLKIALSQTIFKQQRNRVNNLKKQLKEKFYT
jgi:hypothetical protein